jgi:CBS domain containing-hemolysin-like protein
MEPEPAPPPSPTSGGTRGCGASAYSTSFQIGGAIVSAVVSAVVTSQTGSATDPASLLGGFRPAIAVATLVAGLGVVIALTGIRRPAAPVPAMASVR